jgi:hypothetical protein
MFGHITKTECYQRPAQETEQAVKATPSASCERRISDDAQG